MMKHVTQILLKNFPVRLRFQKSYNLIIDVVKPERTISKSDGSVLTGKFEVEFFQGHL